MPEIMQLTLLDKSRPTKINFCENENRKKENFTSKLFQIFTLFCLFVWLQNAFRPAEALILPKLAREERSRSFPIDYKPLEDLDDKTISGKFLIEFFLIYFLFNKSMNLTT